MDPEDLKELTELIESRFGRLRCEVRAVNTQFDKLIAKMDKMIANMDATNARIKWPPPRKRRCT